MKKIMIPPVVGSLRALLEDETLLVLTPFWDVKPPIGAEGPSTGAGALAGLATGEVGALAGLATGEVPPLVGAELPIVGEAIPLDGIFGVGLFTGAGALAAGLQW